MNPELYKHTSHYATMPLCKTGFGEQKLRHCINIFVHTHKNAYTHINTHTHTHHNQASPIVNTCGWSQGVGMATVTSPCQGIASISRWWHHSTTDQQRDAIWATSQSQQLFETFTTTTPSLPTCWKSIRGTKTHTHTHTHAHTHTYMHTNMHTHTHTLTDTHMSHMSHMFKEQINLC